MWFWNIVFTKSMILKSYLEINLQTQQMAVQVNEMNKSTQVLHFIIVVVFFLFCRETRCKTCTSNQVARKLVLSPHINQCRLIQALACSSFCHENIFFALAYSGMYLNTPPFNWMSTIHWVQVICNLKIDKIMYILRNKKKLTIKKERISNQNCCLLNFIGNSSLLYTCGYVIYFKLCIKAATKWSISRRCYRATKQGSSKV